jgi:hypothetical protein
MSWSGEIRHEANGSSVTDHPTVDVANGAQLGAEAARRPGDSDSQVASPRRPLPAPGDDLFHRVERSDPVPSGRLDRARLELEQSLI